MLQLSSYLFICRFGSSFCALGPWVEIHVFDFSISKPWNLKK